MLDDISFYNLFVEMTDGLLEDGRYMQSDTGNDHNFIVVLFLLTTLFVSLSAAVFSIKLLVNSLRFLSYIEIRANNLIVLVEIYCPTSMLSKSLCTLQKRATYDLQQNRY